MEIMKWLNILIFSQYILLCKNSKALFSDMQMSIAFGFMEIPTLHSRYQLFSFL